MTVETTTARVTYTGAGTTGPFSVPFYFLEDDDLTVIKTTIADGTETTLVLTTDYVVSGAADEAGGSVTLTASLSSSYKLTIIRDPDLLQSSDYPPNDKFPATTHERVVDKLTMIAQRLKDLINRSFRLSDGDVSGVSLSLSNLSASKLIAVNSAGTALEAVSAADVGLTPVSAFAATLLDDADAAAARTTLGAASLGANTFTGIQRWAKGADVASANALTLGTDGNYFDITGTTAITSIGTLGVGTVVKLHFDAALTLTHHATDLILPSGANITTAAGDEAEFVEYASGDWRCTSYSKANVLPIAAGKLVQRVEATPFTTYASDSSGSLPIDDTIPQNTEGSWYCSLSITPKSATNRLVLHGIAQVTGNGSNTIVVTLCDSAISNALAVATATLGGANYQTAIPIEHELVAGSTSARTYQLRIGASAGVTFFLNGSTTTRLFGGVMGTRLWVEEIAV